MVRNLEKAGLSRPQSVFLTNTVNIFLYHELQYAQSTFLTRAALEHDVYLYRNALTDIKNDLSNLRATDIDAVQTSLKHVSTELSSLGSQLRDSITQLKADIRAEVTAQKQTVTEEYRTMERDMAEVNHKVATMGSEMKTEIEMMKFEVTKILLFRLFIGGLVVLLVLITWKRSGLLTAKPQRRIAKPDIRQSPAASTPTTTLGSQTTGTPLPYPPEAGDFVLKETRPSPPLSPPSAPPDPKVE